MKYCRTSPVWSLQQYRVIVPHSERNRCEWLDGGGHRSDAVQPHRSGSASGVDPGLSPQLSRFRVSPGHGLQPSRSYENTPRCSRSIFVAKRLVCARQTSSALSHLAIATPQRRWGGSRPDASSPEGFNLKCISFHCSESRGSISCVTGQTVRLVSLPL